MRPGVLPVGEDHLTMRIERRFLRGNSCSVPKCACPICHAASGGPSPGRRRRGRFSPAPAAPPGRSGPRSGRGSPTAGPAEPVAALVGAADQVAAVVGAAVVDAGVPGVVVGACVAAGPAQADTMVTNSAVAASVLSLTSRLLCGPTAGPPLSRGTPEAVLVRSVATVSID